MLRRYATALTISALTLVFAACGGSSTKPDDSCFAVAGNKGTVTADIQGLATFNGRVGTGGANLVSGQSFFTVNAVNVSDGTSVVFSAPASVASTPLPGPLNGPFAGLTMTVSTRSCTAGTGTWTAGIGSGSGTMNVTAFSSTAAVGNFNITLQPVAPTTGTKTISGNFNVTF